MAKWMIWLAGIVGMLLSDGSTLDWHDVWFGVSMFGSGLICAAPWARFAIALTPERERR